MAEGRRLQVPVTSGSEESECSSSVPSTPRGPSPCRAPPSSPQGPRFKLVAEGPLHVCRLNHTRTVISKLLSSRFLRRWEQHHVILEDEHVASRQASGFMEEPIPYRSIIDVYPVARWDSCGRFCIRIVVPDGSLLFQVSNCYLRDQWLYSLLWKKSIYKYRKLLENCTRPEILLKELNNLVDLVLSTPLQDEIIFHTALDVISDVLVKGQTWMTRDISEEVIVTVSSLLERTTPTSEICDFFCWHCREHPRSTVVLDICTPIVQRILKHNMDFGKYPQTRVFVQEYFLALNCQNLGDRIIKDFVNGTLNAKTPDAVPLDTISVIPTDTFLWVSVANRLFRIRMHGLGSKCPHPRVLQNLVNICVAAIYTIFENRPVPVSPTTDESTEQESTMCLEWLKRMHCFVDIFILISAFDDWRKPLAEMLQPIPFHEKAVKCAEFMTRFQVVIGSFAHDERCYVHQAVLGVREDKEGWMDLFSPSSVVCQDDGDLWSAMVDRLLECCERGRRSFVSRAVACHLGPLMLRSLRGDERCQKALCTVLEMDLVRNRDCELQAVATLQSTPSGKMLYAALCDRQAHIRQVQQRGGPRKLVLPNKSTDADVSRLLSSGSFGDLECLSLAFTQVTSACAHELIKLSSLKYLSLWSTQFDDSGLRLLSENLPNLQSLDLCETRVTNGGLATLTEMKSLRRLNLNSTLLEPETFECLKRQLPVLQECDVRYTEAWGF